MPHRQKKNAKRKTWAMILLADVLTEGLRKRKYVLWRIRCREEQQGWPLAFDGDFSFSLGKVRQVCGERREADKVDWTMVGFLVCGRTA